MKLTAKALEKWMGKEYFLVSLGAKGPIFRCKFAVSFREATWRIIPADLQVVNGTMVRKVP